MKIRYIILSGILGISAFYYAYSEELSKLIKKQTVEVLREIEPEKVAEAEMRKAVSSAESIATATESFANKYRALPGDFIFKRAAPFGFKDGGNGDWTISPEESNIAIDHLIEAGLLNESVKDDYVIKFAPSPTSNEGYVILGKPVNQGVTGVISPEFAKARGIKTMNADDKNCNLETPDPAGKDLGCLIIATYVSTPLKGYDE